MSRCSQEKYKPQQAQSNEDELLRATNTEGLKEKNVPGKILRRDIGDVWKESEDNSMTETQRGQISETEKIVSSAQRGQVLWAGLELGVSEAVTLGKKNLRDINQ